MEKLFPQLVNVNLNFIQETVVPQIGIDYAQNAASAVIDKLKQTVVVVTDDNPSNQEQLKQIWGTFTSDPKMYAAFEVAFMTGVNQVQDKVTRDALTLLTPEIVKTLIAVTDNVKPDGQQIESIWKDFAKSPKFLSFLLSNLSLIINKLPLPAWLKAIIPTLKLT